MEILLALVFMTVSGYWLQQGLAVYGFYIDGKPGSGFIPVLFSILVMILSAIALVRAVRTKRAVPSKTTPAGDASPTVSADVDSWKTRLQPLIPAAIAIVGIYAITYLGVVVAVALIAFCWVRFLSHYTVVRSFLFSVPIVLFIYVVFVWWLRVPFPRGVFGF